LPFNIYVIQKVTGCFHSHYSKEEPYVVEKFKWKLMSPCFASVTEDRFCIKDNLSQIWMLNQSPSTSSQSTAAGIYPFL